MSLQSIFYIVSIIAMSLMTFLFVALVVLLFYIKGRINELVKITEKRLNEAKDIMSHPQKMASTVGEALVDTAINQINKMTHPERRAKKR